jgi:acetylornithine deacetylase
MKGFLAQCVTVAENLDARQLSAPLVLLFTCDEEEGCLGAERLLPTLERLRTRWPLPRDCVIGEPTSFRVYRAHKGHVRLRLTTRGRGGHSSRPDLGVNAIAAAAAAAAAVERLAADVRERVRDGDRRLFPEYPAVPFNLGTISGGTADNMIAERCDLVVGFRQVPGHDPEELLAELERRVRSAVVEAAPGATVTVDEVVFTPSMSSPADAHTCRELCRLVGEDDPVGAPYATDGGQLERIGIRSWICGPGELAQAHQPDESLAVADLDRGLELVESLVARRCGPSETSR